MSQVKILDQEEIEKFDSVPSFTYDQRKRFFQIPDSNKRNLIQLRNPVTHAGFILLQGYFRYSGKFFPPKEFLEVDVKFVINQLALKIEPEEILQYIIQAKRHRLVILEMYGFKEFSTEIIGLRKEISQLVEKRVSPKKIFLQTCEWLNSNKIEIPPYFVLQSLITESLNSFEKSLVKIVCDNISDYQKNILDDLLEEDISISLQEQGFSRISRFKKQNHSPRPQKIKEGLAVFEEIQYLFRQIATLTERLNMPVSVITYYATWTLKARTAQIQQLVDPNNRYLHLVSFVGHQYYQRQDLLVDLLLSSVQSISNSVSSEVKEKYFLGKKNRNEALRFLLRSRYDLKAKWEKTKSIVEDHDLNANEKLNELQQLIDSDYEEPETLLKIKELELEMEGPDELSYYDGLEEKYSKLKNKVSGIIKVTEFNYDYSSNSELIEAIEFYKLGSTSHRNLPMSFLTELERKLLVDKNGKFRKKLYNIFLYFHVADAIKSGTLYLKYSYKYLSLEDYLIDKKLWEEDRTMFLKRAELESFSDWDSYRFFMEKVVRDHFTVTNDNINNKSNMYIRISSDGNPIVVTPPGDKPDIERVSSLFTPVHYTSMLNVLLDIGQVTSFLDSFEHFTVKDAKGKPDSEIFFAGIMGYGCNIGISKMGNISKGININTLGNTVNWYFTLDNIISANDRLVNYIDSLPLSKLFKKHQDALHTSSDGQKFGIKVDSLNSNYSYKYHGKGRGVSVHSFIDERFALFYSSVVSSSEREAAFVIDGMMHNDVIKSDIHSTDTHGYSEIVFGVMNLLGITFAPRIQNFKDQQLYSIDHPNIYNELTIQPDKKIDVSLIEPYWDDVLRFVASIKLKHVTASQLMKRLSSYSKQHPLYKALKEFGKIHKTVFLLRYMDDMELRSRIEKQLNKIELSHKFAKAVFFGGNQEFKQESREGQEIVTGCRRLVQNAIILWNYFYLSELIAQEDTLEKKREVLEIIQGGSILTWQHINLHGEYNFDNLNKGISTFNIDKIMNMKIEID